MEGLIMKEYIYILKLIKRLWDEHAWTEDDEHLVSEHFMRLKRDSESGKVLLAGKTDNEDKFSLGLVIFKAENYNDAMDYAESDPAVKGGIMTVECMPYRLAIHADMNDYNNYGG